MQLRSALLSAVAGDGGGAGVALGPCMCVSLHCVPRHTGCMFATLLGVLPFKRGRGQLHVPFPLVNIKRCTVSPL